MPKTFGQITSFKSGQIGDTLTSQVTSEHYKTGLKLATNCFIDVYGTLRKRPGSKYLYTANDADKTLVPFTSGVGVGHGLLLGTADTKALDKDGSVTSTPASVFSTTVQSYLVYVQDKESIYFTNTTNATTGMTCPQVRITYSSGAFTADNLAITALALDPARTKYVPTDGYAITSMTVLAAEGQTGYTISGANPGPFTGGNGFTADDQHVIYAQDGVFQITSVTNNYTLVTTCRRAPSSTNASVLSWRFEMTAGRQFGRVITTHNQRLVAAHDYNSLATDKTLNVDTVLMSAINDYTDWYPGPNDDDSIFIRLNKCGTAGITWMYSAQDLLVGTDVGVFSISGSTPSEVKAIERAGPGGILQTPIGAHGGVYYISSTARNVRFMKYDDRLQGYTNDDITLPIQEEFENSTITRIAATTEPYPIIFVCTAAGKIYAGTVIKNALYQSPIVAWSLFADNDKTVWSNIISVRNNNVDELWAFATRSTTYTVEKFTFNDGTDLTDIYTDGSVVYSGGSTSSITGLSHLNGLVCQVKGNGVQLGNETPSGGSVTIDSACTTAVVGLSYGMEARTLPLFIPAGNVGSYTFQKNRWCEPILNVVKSVKPQVDGKAASKYRESAVTLNGMTFYTGPLYYGNIDSGSLTITDDTPFPVHITGIFGQIEYGG